jgi:dihydroflavonol-4-reductase
MVMGPADLTCIAGQFVTRAARGDVFPLPKGGTNVIDVRDAARAHIAAAEHAAPGDRYLLGGHNMTHAEYLSVIGEVVGVTIKHVQLPRWVLPSLADGVTVLRTLGARTMVDRARILLSAKYMYYDSSKAVRELGLGTRPFPETVRDTLLWYDRHGLLHEDAGAPFRPVPWWRQVLAEKTTSHGASSPQ